MVLQRNKNVPVWGGATNGQTVTVSFAGQVKNTVAADGKWKVELDPIAADHVAYTLNVTCAGDSINYTNILMGDVWLGTGQSNAGVNVGYFPTLYAQESSANFPEIRHMYNPPFTSSTPLDSLDIAGNFTWYTANTPTNINLLSAMSYMFTKELYLETGVPQGVVYCWNAGTYVSQWMVSGNCYNAMLHPISYLAFTGVHWYQGESDCLMASLYNNYDTNLTTMIGQWRSVLNNGDFPFLIVGLPAYADIYPYPADSWAILREKQVIVDRTVQNTALTAQLDNTDRTLHPDNKREVGHRLAIAALAKDYGQSILYTGPRYDSVVFESGEAIITFKNGGANLTAAGAIQGFRIGTSKANLVDASAAFLGTDQVRVWNAAFPSPTVVYYGWENNPISAANLCDEVGNPTAPFRTDMPYVPILDTTDHDYEPPCVYPDADINKDCVVDYNDLQILASEWLAGGPIGFRNYMPRGFQAGTVADCNVPFATTAPVIDGVLNPNEWDNAMALEVIWPDINLSPKEGFVLEGVAPASADDFSSTWYLKWDASNLYIAASVYDSSPAFIETDGWYHQGDCMQIGLDLTQTQPPIMSGTSALYDFAAETFDNSGAALARHYGGAKTGNFTAPELAAISVASTLLSDGYIIELALPWSVLDNSGLGYTPSAGDTHGIEFLNIDFYPGGGAISHSFVPTFPDPWNTASWKTLTLVNTSTQHSSWAWNTGIQNYPIIQADLEPDGIINIADLAVLAEHWLEGVAP